MKRVSFPIMILFGWTLMTVLSTASAQMPPAYPKAQQSPAMADAIRANAKSVVSSLKSLTEKALEAAKTDEERKKAEAQLLEVEWTLKMFDQMKVTVYVTADPIDKVKSFYEEKLKITFRDEQKPLEELANGLKLSGFDKVNPEDFKGMTIRLLTYLDREKRLEIEIDDKGIDPTTGELVPKTIINFISFPK